MLAAWPLLATDLRGSEGFALLCLAEYVYTPRLAILHTLLRIDGRRVRFVPDGERWKTNESMTGSAGGR